ncbi:hypothetical protein Q3G72_034077 [Acer saccharum]|nr:hypothetical protein Q3G72_034077 [Acer saccharum]
MFVQHLPYKSIPTSPKRQHFNQFSRGSRPSIDPPQKIVVGLTKMLLVANISVPFLQINSSVEEELRRPWSPGEARHTPHDARRRTMTHDAEREREKFGGEREDAAMIAWFSFEDEDVGDDLRRLPDAGDDNGVIYGRRFGRREREIGERAAEVRERKREKEERECDWDGFYMGVFK